MALYLFENKGEFALVETTGTELFISSSLTHGKYVNFTPDLYKPNREKMAQARFIMINWPKLTEEERDVYLVLKFAKMGYKLIEKRF